MIVKIAAMSLTDTLLALRQQMAFSISHLLNQRKRLPSLTKKEMK